VCHPVHEISELTDTHTHSQTHTQTHTNTNTHKHTQNIYFTSTDETRCRQSVITFAVQQQFYRAMSLLWLLVSVLSPRMPGFASSQVCIGFMVGKAAVGLVCLRTLLFYPVDITPPPFRTLSAIHHQHNVKVILAAASLSKTQNDICKRHAGATLSERCTNHAVSPFTDIDNWK